MRLLIVTHGSLTAQLGASQLAINLGEALRARGHDVTLWSPQPLPPGTRWWQALQTMRRKLDEFLETQPPFDVIDCPPSFITKRVRRSRVVVARSVQPYILYLLYDLSRAPRWSPLGLARAAATVAHTLFHIILILRGWGKATHILCLGSVELGWMRRYTPWWRKKLLVYFGTLSATEQAALSTLRRQRQKPAADRLRFIWTGRWAAHKGTDSLLAFIRAWSALRPQDRFTIAGCGQEAERECPAELIQSGVIKLVPSFSRGRLCSLLAEHDVGLFTSRLEGWGISLNEMLESGIPVYATEVGGVPDLKAVFGDSLQPFPPFLISPFLLPPGGADMSHYYEVFTWERIAERYIEGIGATMPEQSKTQTAVELTAHNLVGGASE